MIKTAAIALAFLAWAGAQTRPNFTGVWAESDRMRAKIDHSGDTFSVTLRVVQGKETDQQSMKYDIGRESKNELHGAPMSSRAEWDGDALVIRSVAVIMGKELKLTDRFTLSADGKTITFQKRHQYGTEPEGEDVRRMERRPAEPWEPDAPPKLAEEVYKNIQIMKGVPAPRLRTVMMNLTKWLGVECAHCHVMGAFEKDDKPPKQRAREMFQMVRAIGGEYFKGANPVTCWTCHRGAARPQSLPAQ